MDMGHPARYITPKRVMLGAALVFSSLFYFTIYSKPSPSIKPSTTTSLDVVKLKCTPPIGMKEISYGLMIDAGSTGSRLHLYTFQNCNPLPNSLPVLVSEGFFTTKPGLSSYGEDSIGAANSLKSLLDHGLAGVPKSEQGCTRIEVKATAGLRLLGTSTANKILQSVSKMIISEYPFSLANNGVTIMEGKDEGVYAWITINFLLNLIGPSAPSSTSSAAIMDLGGASTQIVFEPKFSSPTVKLSPGDHVYDLNFAGKDYILYQHSHLGFGLMQARRSINNLIAFNFIWSQSHKKNIIDWDSLDSSVEIPNPCMYSGSKKVVELDPPGRDSKKVTMIGTGNGYEACKRITEIIINKEELCTLGECAFGGIYQPSLREVFNGKIYALSYFTDRLITLNLPTSLTISQLRALTKAICAGPNSSLFKASFGSLESESKKELLERGESCLDFNFMLSLLSHGYDLEEEREIFIGKKVEGVELGWSLGAAIAMVTNSDLTCRAD